MSVKVLRVDFYCYHVTIVSKDDSAKTFLRFNPIWNKKNNSIHQVTNSWFDWVEVNWENRNGNFYTVTAKLLLWGNVIYSDGTESLLASVCLLRSTKNMIAHDRMFFAEEGDAK